MHASLQFVRTNRSPWIASFCAVLFVVLPVDFAVSQTTPDIDYLFPPGAQRGTETEVILKGKFMPGPCAVITAGKGLTTNSSEVTDKFSLKINAKAEFGPHEIRLSSAQGASAPFPFIVGEIPELTRQNSREVIKPKLPVTINGRLEQDRDIHRYTLELSAGQQVVCAVMTSSFGSSLDPTMRMLDSSGQIVAESFENRSADGLLVYRAPTAGEYTLQVFDFQLAGSERHIYRLTLTDGPWLDYAFPTSITQGQNSEVTLVGWNLPGPNDRSVQQSFSAAKAGTLPVRLPNGINQLELNVHESPSHTESEPNDSATAAEQISSPVTISGRLQKPGDTDFYCFSAEKGETLFIELLATQLKSPLDAVLSIFDESGKSLKEVDDVKTSRDPEIRFVAPADGKFCVSITDRSLRGGEAYFYRLQIGPLKPDVDARIDVASFTLLSGATAKLPIKVQRLDGFEGELEIIAKDLPSGFTVPAQPVPKGAATTVQMEITAGEKLAPGGGLCSFIVRAKDAATPQEWPVEVYESAKATSSSQNLWLAVVPEIPFTLKTTSVILDAPRLAAFPFPVTVNRKEGFTGLIKLVGVEPDRRGSVFPLEGSISADSNQGAIPLVIRYGVREGTTQRCRVMGVVDVLGADGKAYPVFHVAPGNMLMGCGPSYLTMIAQPEVLIAQPDATLTLKVQLMKHVQMSEVEVKIDLPEEISGIHCEPVVVAPNQSEAILTLRIDKDAVFPPRAEITIQAESIHNDLPVYGEASFRLETP